MQLLTPQEVVERYRGAVTVRTLTNWRSLGSGPKWLKVGKAVLYPLENLREWEHRGNQRDRHAKAG